MRSAHAAPPSALSSASAQLRTVVRAPHLLRSVPLAVPRVAAHQPLVSAYLSEHSHATTEGRKAELEKSEAGQQIMRLLAEFDSIRDLFDLRNTASKHSKVEMYCKMVPHYTEVPLSTLVLQRTPRCMELS